MTIKMSFIAADFLANDYSNILDCACVRAARRTFPDYHRITAGGCELTTRPKSGQREDWTIDQAFLNGQRLVGRGFSEDMFNQVKAAFAAGGIVDAHIVLTKVED